MSVHHFEHNSPFGIAVYGQQIGCLQYKQQSVKVLFILLFIYGSFNDAVSNSDYIV
jgi:hypothetical protein